MVLLYKNWQGLHVLGSNAELSMLKATKNSSNPFAKIFNPSPKKRMCTQTFGTPCIEDDTFINLIILDTNLTLAFEFHQLSDFLMFYIIITLL